MVHHEVRNTLHFAVRWAPDGSLLRVAHRYQLADRDVIELHSG